MKENNESVERFINSIDVDISDVLKMKTLKEELDILNETQQKQRRIIISQQQELLNKYYSFKAQQ